MFRMKGNLLFPTIIGALAIVLGVIALLSPNRANGGVGIWGALAGLFGVYVICGVIVSWRARRR